MKNNTIIKIILILFFTTFFSFLFWFFYEPTIVSEKNKEEEKGFLSVLFPFLDNGSDFVLKDKEEDNKIKKEEKIQKKIKENIPKLRQISNIPTVSAHIESISKLEIFDINKKRKNFEKLNNELIFSEIRYIAIKNNYVYQTYDFTKKNTKISNITIPKITQADFFDKNNFLIKYKNELDILKTYLVNISDKSELEIENQEDDLDNSDLKKFQGIFFPDNIKDLYINKKNELVFYTTFYNREKEIDGNIYGILTTKNAEDKKEIFKSNLKEWNFSFNNKNFIFASNKNSGSANSIAFSLNTKNSSFDKISKAEKGLNGLPNNDFSKILYSQQNDTKEYILVIDDLKTKIKKNIKVSTFIDKCVWSRDNINIYCAVPINTLGTDQPDKWYKGKNYFRDNILKINSETGVLEYIFDTVVEGQYFDIIDLKIDDREKYLYWKDKKSDFVWSYNMYF